MGLFTTAVAFILVGSSVFMTTFYLNVFRETDGKGDTAELDHEPEISILMPAYNEENSVETALENALNLDYSNYNVYFVDDGSTDKTLQIAKQFRAYSNLELIEHLENKGKAAALNTGLERIGSDYTVVVDADSAINGNLLRSAAAKMESNSDLGGVISSIMPLSTNTLIRRIQVIEYRLNNFYRRLMTDVNILDVTPGAFSMYRTEDLKRLGGFDVGNITEDLEMAWRLRKDGREFQMVYDKVSNSEMPKNVRQLYEQRVRWARGRIVNSYHYRDMFFNSKYDWFGIFQMPVSIIFALTAVAGLGMIIAGIGEMVYNSYITLSSVGFTLPTINLNLYRLILGLDLKIYIPLLLSLVMVAYVIKQAYKKSGETVDHPIALTIYFLLYFVAKASFWAAAILKEMFRTKRIWK